MLLQSVFMVDTAARERGQAPCDHGRLRPQASEVSCYHGMRVPADLALTRTLASVRLSKMGAGAPWPAMQVRDARRQPNPSD